MKMQAYQSFNPQAYNAAAAAAAVSAAAYYHHHHHHHPSSNYVLSPQYTLDGFAYNPSATGTTVAQSGFGPNPLFQNDYMATSQTSPQQYVQATNHHHQHQQQQPGSLIGTHAPPPPPTYLTMNTTQNNIYTNVCYNNANTTTTATSSSSSSSSSLSSSSSTSSNGGQLVTNAYNGCGQQPNGLFTTNSPTVQLSLIGASVHQHHHHHHNQSPTSSSTSPSNNNDDMSPAKTPLTTYQLNSNAAIKLATGELSFLIYFVYVTDC
jgi:hypothetical protein